MRDLSFFELPHVVVLIWHRLLDHVVVVVDEEELVDDYLIVWHVSIVQARDVSHDVLHLLHALGRADP